MYVLEPDLKILDPVWIRIQPVGQISKLWIRCTPTCNLAIISLKHAANVWKYVNLFKSVSGPYEQLSNITAGTMGLGGLSPLLLTKQMMFLTKHILKIFRRNFSPHF